MTVCMHSEDVDGWLAHPNRPMAEVNRRFLSEVHGMEEGGFRIEVVLNSGKSPRYLLVVAESIHGTFVIGCNGAAWQKRGSPVRLVASLNDDFRRLRQALALPATAVGKVTALVLGQAGELVIEEGKQVDGKDIVLTLFPEEQLVAHRWSFRGFVDRWRLKEAIEGVIFSQGLRLAVLEPHADGGLDVVPVVDGRPLAKWTLPQVARAMFPNEQLRIAHGGDGVNDLAAMQAEGVFPITSRSCVEVVSVVRQRGGYVADASAPDGGSLMEAYRHLAQRGHYGPLSPRVAQLCEKHLCRVGSRETALVHS